MAPGHQETTIRITVIETGAQKTVILRPTKQTRVTNKSLKSFIKTVCLYIIYINTVHTRIEQNRINLC